MSLWPTWLREKNSGQEKCVMTPCCREIPVHHYEKGVTGGSVYVYSSRSVWGCGSSRGAGHPLSGESRLEPEISRIFKGPPCDLFRPSMFLQLPSCQSSANLLIKCPKHESRRGILDARCNTVKCKENISITMFYTGDVSSTLSSYNRQGVSARPRVRLQGC